MEKELQQNAMKACVLTVYHRPPFSSGLNGGANGTLSPWVASLFHKSFKWGVDLTLAGHEHFFSRLPPLNPTGNVDGSFGVPTLVGGTGGAILFPDPRHDTVVPKAKRVLRWAAGDELVLAKTLGIIRLDLKPQEFRWQFIPVDPESGRMYPSGAGTCHGNPPGFIEPAA